MRRLVRRAKPELGGWSGVGEDISVELWRVWGDVERGKCERLKRHRRQMKKLVMRGWRGSRKGGFIIIDKQEEEKEENGG